MINLIFELRSFSVLLKTSINTNFCILVRKQQRIKQLQSLTAVTMECPGNSR